MYTHRLKKKLVVYIFVMHLSETSSIKGRKPTEQHFIQSRLTGHIRAFRT